MVDKDTSGMTTRDGKSIVSQSTQQRDGAVEIQNSQMWEDT